MEHVAIITFHCSYNYGSALQAFALKSLLEKKKYEVSIINFIYKKDFEQYCLFRSSLYCKNIK